MIKCSLLWNALSAAKNIPRGRSANRPGNSECALQAMASFVEPECSGAALRQMSLLCASHAACTLIPRQWQCPPLKKLLGFATSLDEGASASASNPSSAPTQPLNQPTSADCIEICSCVFKLLFASWRVAPQLFMGDNCSDGAMSAGVESCSGATNKSAV